MDEKSRDLLRRPAPLPPAGPSLDGGPDLDAAWPEGEGDVDADGGEAVAPAGAAHRDDAGRRLDGSPASVADVPVGIPHAGAPSAAAAEMHVEMTVALVRAVALHGPIPRVALESWHVESEGDQRAAVAWLLGRGFVAETAEGVELRGLAGKRKGPLTTTQAELVESTVRMALLAARWPSGGASMSDVSREGARGLQLARKADAEKKGGR